MPKNRGHRPKAEKVDIQYREGTVVRDVDPKSRRWTLNDPAFGKDYAFDIVSWQEAT